MPAHDSQYPDEHKPRSFRVDPSGISMNWRYTSVAVGAIFAAFAGTGGYASFRLVTEAQVNQKIVASESRTTREVKAVDDKVEVLKTEISGPAGLKATIGDLQHVQHSDIAIREARRVVDEEVACRRNDDECQERKDYQRERLRRTNMERLKNKREPCASLVCD